MLSLLLITALAVQTPQTSKPSTSTTDSTASRRSTTAQRGTSTSAIGRQAFHDRMRELWTDHVTYTRNFIVSAAAGLADTAEVSQRLLRNQDEIGEAIKPYYGDAAGSQLASLLRNHIQLAAKTLMAAKGTTTAMNTQNQSSTQLSYSTTSDTTQARMNSQYPSNPSASTRMTDTTQARRSNVTNDTTLARTNSQSPNAQARRNQSDTTKRNPNARVTGDTMSQRLPSNQYGNVQPTTPNADSTQKNTDGNTSAQGQSQYGVTQQTGQVDSTSLNQAIAALKANGDSIADFLAKANSRGFSREMLSSGLQMHITLLLKEATAQIKKDWSGSISAYDESQRQILQMADMLSEGIMKQFPSRFSNKATAVSSR